MQKMKKMLCLALALVMVLAMAASIKRIKSGHCPLFMRK